MSSSEEVAIVLKSEQRMDSWVGLQENVPGRDRTLCSACMPKGPQLVQGTEDAGVARV